MMNLDHIPEAVNAMVGGIAKMITDSTPFGGTEKVTFDQYEEIIDHIDEQLADHSSDLYQAYEVKRNATVLGGFIAHGENVASVIYCNDPRASIASMGFGFTTINLMPLSGFYLPLTEDMQVDRAKLLAESSE